MGRGKRRPDRQQALATASKESYRLVGPDGVERLSRTKGELGGHRSNRIYGRLDCPAALQWLAAGYYVKQRVFFASEEDAVAAGYRPCGCCLPGKYHAWKSGLDPLAAEAGAMREPPPLRLPAR
jgi:hypothetical protein